MHSSRRTNKKKNSCIFMHQTYIFQQGQNEEQRPSRLSTRSKKKRPSRLSIRSLQSKIYDPLVSVQGQNEKKKRPLVSIQGHFNLKFTTLWSQYKVNMKKKKRTTLSSQYKVTSIQNLLPSRLSTRSK